MASGKNPKKNYFAWTGFQGKTLWDWLQLLAALAIPVAVAAGTLWFTAAQGQVGERASAQQHQTDLQIATDQQQETALQNYLDRMSDLLLNDNLRTSKPGDEVREVARARTLTVLSQLSGTRKSKVVHFLYEAGLILDNAVVDLSSADLSNIDLSSANLGLTNLSGANLSKVTQVKRMNDPNSIIFLDDADLSDADLSGADLESAHLSLISGANLSDAFLQGAHLRGADLTGISLYNAHLWRADLTNAELSHAYLSDADLSSANLTGTKGVTNEQLSKAQSLQGATMPDGSKHP